MVRAPSGAERLLLAVIVAGVDPDTGLCEITLPALARACASTPAAVSKLLQRMAARGLELRVPYRAGADGRPVYAAPGMPYRLHAPAAAVERSPVKPPGQPRTQPPKGGQQPAAEGGQVSTLSSGLCPQCAAQSKGGQLSGLDPKGGHKGGQTAGQSRADTSLPLTKPPPPGVEGRAPARTREAATTRRFFADGSARDFDPVTRRVYYRCPKHLHLTVRHGAGEPCGACARVRRTYATPRRARREDPMPGQRPLVAVLDGGGQPAAGECDHTRCTPATCPHNRQPGRVKAG